MFDFLVANCTESWLRSELYEMDTHKNPLNVDVGAIPEETELQYKLTGPKSLVKTREFSALRPGPPVIGTLKIEPEGGRCLLRDQTPHLSDTMCT